MTYTHTHTTILQQGRCALSSGLQAREELVCFLVERDSLLMSNESIWAHTFTGEVSPLLAVIRVANFITSHWGGTHHRPVLWTLFQKEAEMCNLVGIFPQKIVLERSMTPPVLTVWATGSQTFKVILTQLQVKWPQWVHPSLIQAGMQSALHLLWCGRSR